MLDGLLGAICKDAKQNMKRGHIVGTISKQEGAGPI